MKNTLQLTVRRADNGFVINGQSDERDEVPRLLVAKDGADVKKKLGEIVDAVSFEAPKISPGK
jgi:hypothetical protein